MAVGTSDKLPLSVWLGNEARQVSRSIDKRSRYRQLAMLLPALSVFGHASNPYSLSSFFFLVHKETTRKCTFSCPHSRSCHTLHPLTRLHWCQFTPRDEMESHEPDTRKEKQGSSPCWPPSGSQHYCLPLLGAGPTSACAGHGCVHDVGVATMLRECLT